MAQLFSRRLTRGAHAQRDSHRFSFKKLAAIAVTGALAASSVAFATLSAQAAVTEPMKKVYSEVVNGDFVMVGNGVMKCGDSPVSSARGNCDDLHNGVALTGNYNDYFRMVNAQAAPDLVAVQNSSQATVTIPAGSAVVRAQLYWSANTGVNAGNQSCGSSGPPAELPTGSYRDRRLSIKAGAHAPVVTVGPDAVYVDDPNKTQYYSAFADVTAQFSALPSGAAQTVSVGDIWAPSGHNCYAGWSLALVYSFDMADATKPESFAKRVSLYQGHVRLDSSNKDGVGVRFDGFDTAMQGVRAGFTIYEGDRNIVGDTAHYQVDQNSYEILNAAEESGNIGTSVANGSIRYHSGASDEPRFTNANVDVIVEDLVHVPAGADSVNIQLKTAGDSYLLQNLVLSAPVAAISINKSFDGTHDVQAVPLGTSPSFTFVVQNTSAVTLTDVSVSDELAPGCARTFGGELAPAQAWTFTCSGPASEGTAYTNSATATAKYRNGTANVSATDTSDVQPTAIGLQKDGQLAAGATGAAGDTVEYTFAVTNTGSSVLGPITLVDPMDGLSPLVWGQWPSQPNSLKAGETVNATAHYVLTQADVDAGRVTNAAQVSGIDPQGHTVNASDDAEVPVVSRPAIQLIKEATLAPPATGKVGETATYTFTAKNTGNVTLTGVEISDPLPGLSELTYGSWPVTAGTLAPGESISASATYVFTQPDVDAAQVSNRASVAGTPPSGPPVTDISTVVLGLSPDSAITLEKTGALAANGQGAAGDRVDYTFVATNTGETTLFGVEIVDPLDGLSPITMGVWPGTPGELLPGHSVQGTAYVTLTQQQADAGRVINTATVTGKPTVGGPVTDSDRAEVIFTASPAISLTKVGTLVAEATGKAGDRVDYTFTVTNTGPQTLTGVTLSDELNGLSPVVFGAWPGTTGVLAPGEAVTATAHYLLTQGDVDAGQVINAAQTRGLSPQGAIVVAAAQDVVPVPYGARISLEKEASIPDGATVGDSIDYSFTVTNTGTQTLAQVTLADPLPGLSDMVFGAWPAAEGVLAPGESVEASATVVITQGHLDAGVVENTASVTGTPAVGSPVSDTDTAVVSVTGTSHITLKKSGALSSSSAGKVGDTITFTFVAINTGSLTLSNVEITDPMDGLGAITYGAWPSVVGVLEPGQSVTATAHYALRATDVTAKRVDNTATVGGKSAQGEVVTHAATATVSIPSTEVAALPFTGADVFAPAAAGLILLILGAGAALIGRHRVRA